MGEEEEEEEAAAGWSGGDCGGDDSWSVGLKWKVRWTGAEESPPLCGAATTGD